MSKIFYSSSHISIGGWQPVGEIEETSSLFSEEVRNNAVSEKKTENNRWADKGKFYFTAIPIVSITKATRLE